LNPFNADCRLFPKPRN